MTAKSQFQIALVLRDIVQAPWVLLIMTFAAVCLGVFLLTSGITRLLLLVEAGSIWLLGEAEYTLKLRISDPEHRHLINRKASHE